MVAKNLLQDWLLAPKMWRKRSSIHGSTSFPTNLTANKLPKASVEAHSWLVSRNKTLNLQKTFDLFFQANFCWILFHQPNHTKPLAPWQKRVLHRSCLWLETGTSWSVCCALIAPQSKLRTTSCSVASPGTWSPWRLTPDWHRMARHG